MEELNEASQEQRFWFERVEWSKLPEGSFDGTLFSARVPLPIELPSLDETCAPYVSGYGSDARPIASLRELVTSEELTAGFGLHPADTNVHERIIDQVNVVNLRENENGEIVRLPIRFCFEQGWWCVSFRIHAIVPHVKESRAEHSRRAGALLELLGKPTYIMVADRDRDDFDHALRNGTGRICYYPVYEWEDYVLVFHITDIVSPEFRLSTLTVGSCLYYAKPLWEYDKVGKHIIWSSKSQTERMK